MSQDFLNANDTESMSVKMRHRSAHTLGEKEMKSYVKRYFAGYVNGDTLAH